MTIEVLTDIRKEVFSLTLWYNASDDGNTGASNGFNIRRRYSTSLNI
jgi:hypothetical protein